jgi:hypothetical protein
MIDKNISISDTHNHSVHINRLQLDICFGVKNSFLGGFAGAPRVFRESFIVGVVNKCYKSFRKSNFFHNFTSNIFSFCVAKQYLKKSNSTSMIRLLFLVTILALFSNCTSTKNIQTSKVNVDSIVNAEKLKLTQKHESEIREYQKHLEELTSSGVTFVVDSCPERDLLPLLLDSTGKANYEKMLLENKIKSLSNKVTISEKGLITAEGNISSAYFSKSVLENELQRSERTIDSMQIELDSSHARLIRVETEKTKVVKRKPVFGGYAMTFGAGAFCMLLFLWWFNTKRKAKSTIMNKVTVFILSAFMLTSCDSHDKPTDNISFGQAWGYSFGLGAYWIWLILAVAALLVGGYLLKKVHAAGKWSGGHTAIVAVLVALVFAALLATPASIAANTTVEQAARGVYIR